MNRILDTFRRLFDTDTTPRTHACRLGCEALDDRSVPALLGLTVDLHLLGIGVHVGSPPPASPPPPGSPPPPPAPAPAPASLSGTVADTNGTAMAGVTIRLDGTDEQGNSVSLTVTTDANGAFSFTGLAAGTYSLTEYDYSGGSATAGTVNGQADGQADPGGDTITGIVLHAGDNGTGYTFTDQMAGT